MASEAQFNTTAVSGSDQHWMVPASISPVQILAAGSEQRAHASIFNDTSGSLLLKYGSDAGVAVGTSGTWDVKLTSGSYYELPKPIWQGEVWGVWDAAVGGWARVLQLGVGK